MERYQVHSNYGAAIFTNEDDAIAALWLLGPYHDIEIDRKTVKRHWNTPDTTKLYLCL